MTAIISYHHQTAKPQLQVHVMIQVVCGSIRFHWHASGCGEDDSPNGLYESMPEDIAVHPEATCCASVGRLVCHRIIRIHLLKGLSRLSI
jgi:hypothetical protein